MTEITIVHSTSLKSEETCFSTDPVVTILLQGGDRVVLNVSSDPRCMCVSE